MWKINQRSWRAIFVAMVVAFLLLGCAALTSSFSQIEVATHPAETVGSPIMAVPTVSTVGIDQLASAAMLPATRSDLVSLSPDLTKYQIDLSVNYTEHTFQAHSRVAYTNTEEISQASLYFRLFPNGHKSYGDGSLTVSQVQVAGAPASTQLSLSDSVLEVILPAPLAVGKGTHLDFDFSGILPVNFGRNEGAAGYGIYNASQDSMTLSGWYPILAVDDRQGWHLDPVSAIGDSVYSRTAYYRVSVTTRSDLVLASTGVEIGQKAAGDQLTHQLVSGPVRDFVLVLGPGYRILSQTVDGTRLNSYYLPGDEDGGQAALNVAADSLRVYNQRFGGYPYLELDVVETPLHYALGVEYPTIVLISSALYGNTQENNFEGAVAHEVAHQWWYGVVGNNVIDEPWLDEAMATYSTGLYYEDRFGTQGYQGYFKYIQGGYDLLLSSGKDDLVTQKLGYFEQLNDPSIYSRVVYSKGALFFKAVRDELGDQAFFKALQDYYRKNKYQVATARDLLSAFDAAAGRSLNDLYQTWLYSAKK